MRPLLYAAAAAAALLLQRQRRRKRLQSQREQQRRHQLKPLAAATASLAADGAPSGRGKHTAPPPQLVHAYTDAAPPTKPLSAAYAASSLLLAAALGAALLTCAVLVLRGQHEAAAAAALLWFLGAPLVLAAGPRLARAAAAAGPAPPPADATVLVEDEPALPSPEQLQHYAGTWIKDASRSDSMDAAMRLVKLNPMMRQAVKLIRGVQLGLDEQDFTFAVFSVISWFKIVERYPWSGKLVDNRRRDMRRGKSQGRVRVTPRGTLQLDFTWSAPHAGHARDEFVIDDAGRLRLSCEVHVGSEAVRYTQVYNRKAPSSGGGAAAAAKLS